MVEKIVIDRNCETKKANLGILLVFKADLEKKLAQEISVVWGFILQTNEYNLLLSSTAVLPLDDWILFLSF